MLISCDGFLKAEINNTIVCIRQNTCPEAATFLCDGGDHVIISCVLLSYPGK